MKFEVGQKWETRDGRVAEVVLVDGECGGVYPVIARIVGIEANHSFTEHGRYFLNSPSTRDLVRLIEEVKPKLFFAKGQKWLTRDGRVATVATTDRGSRNYPIGVAIGDDPFVWSYCEEGTPYKNQGDQHDRDLVTLISNPPGVFKVGQKWETRGGNVVTITRTDRNHQNYPIAGLVEGAVSDWTFSETGQYWRASITPGARDLVRLIEDVPAGDVPPNESWIEWNGSENPVPGAKVDYVLRNSDTYRGIESDSLRWDTYGSNIPFDIVKYKVVEEAPETMPEGWVKWEGGENPVPGAIVEYRMRNSETCEDEADDLRWDHHGTAGDIVAYRVTEEAEHTQEPTPEPEPKPAPFTVTEPGDYVTRDGRKVVVVALNLRGSYPLLGYIVGDDCDNVNTWCANGKPYTDKAQHPLDIVGRWAPWANLAIDTPVWVKDKHDAEWMPRHFAGVSDGKPTTWTYGVTSHSALTGGSTNSWDELSLTKPE